MELDDEVCLCFHVTKRKLQNYIRIEKPRRAAQLSDCFGAGTGCGWCRTYLQNMFSQLTDDESNCENGEISANEYAKSRSGYIRDGGGTPPAGATPMVDDS